MSSPLTPFPETWKSDALSLFLRLLPASFFELLPSAQNQNNRIYTIPVVLWLFILQRLQPLASLQTAVLELLRGLPPALAPPLPASSRLAQRPQISIQPHRGLQ